MEPNRSEIGNYQIIRTLGHGLSSVVKLAKDNDTDEYVALKLMKEAQVFTQYAGIEQHFYENISPHENVLNFYGCKRAIYCKKYSQEEVE